MASKKIQADRNAKATVHRLQDGSVEILLHAQMRDPDTSFYADRLEVVKVSGGVHVLAVYENPLTGESERAVDIAMDDTAYSRFVDSMRSIRHLLSQESGALPPMRGSPHIVAAYKAIAAFVATHAVGVSLDFYAYAPVDFHRAGQETLPIPQLRPLVRVEILPGRLGAILGDYNPDEVT